MSGENRIAALRGRDDAAGGLGKRRLPPDPPPRTAPDSRLDFPGARYYNAGMSGRTVLFVCSATPHALRSAGSCALAAVSMEQRVDVFLTGPAVGAVVAGHDGDADEPTALLHQARAAGARLIACSASVVEQRVALDRADAALDAVVGWPTILEWSRGVVDRFTF